MHPSAEQLLRWFDSSHLPPELQDVVKPIEALAHLNARTLDGQELTAGLRKLLEAKDCFVRAALDAGKRDPALYGAGSGSQPSAGVTVCTCPAGLRAPASAHMPSCPSARATG